MKIEFNKKKLKHLKKLKSNKMKNLFKIICIFFLSITVNSQTVTALQQQNARATGYAIVAAKNPGKSFSVFMVKWDGVHDLEYNANNQINPGWHPQAAIKGNYFDQAFVNNDFTLYSSVVVSQAEFDNYKDAGSDWWIVCSTLPSFSNTGLSISDNGNVGIGTTSPNSTLQIGDSNGSGAPTSEIEVKRLSLAPVTHSGSDWFFTTRDNNPYANLDIGYSNNKTLTLRHDGNVGIGTTNPTSKLTVAGNITSREVKVTVDAGADFVFENDYSLPSLQEIEKYVSENKHLPEIASAKEMKENGINLSEMNIKLLQKMEEMTLYIIEQEKRINIQSNKIETLEKENQTFNSLSERLSKLESQSNK
jgi:hypothetical protein